jgi:hypothetical protein
MVIDNKLKHHDNVVHVKPHGSNVGCLLGFLANHDCFTYACCPTKIYSEFW